MLMNARPRAPRARRPGRVQGCARAVHGRWAGQRADPPCRACSRRAREPRDRRRRGRARARVRRRPRCPRRRPRSTPTWRGCSTPAPARGLAGAAPATSPLAGPRLEPPPPCTQRSAGGTTVAAGRLPRGAGRRTRGTVRRPLDRTRSIRRTGRPESSRGPGARGSRHVPRAPDPTCTAARERIARRPVDGPRPPPRAGPRSEPIATLPPHRRPHPRGVPGGRDRRLHRHGLRARATPLGATRSVEQV